MRQQEPDSAGKAPQGLREAEKANIPFLAALAGALRRCSSLVWLATRRSERLALHPASAPKNGTLAISASLSTLLAQQPVRAVGILAVSVIGWVFLAWIAVDMSHPLAQLTMPDSSSWSAASVLAIWLMWALMMAAMMLPSALPMILTFVNLSLRSGEPARGHSFVTAYLLVWFIFSAGATAAQWALQAMGWVNPMIVSTSTVLTALLLLIAGVYQFSRLKHVCLSRCRTPLGFLLGEWRAGVRGAFVMGLRHGLFCVGCCWALMALLFVGGVMNLAWIAALSIAVAIEKLAPRGERLAAALGLGLIVAGLVKLLALAI